MAVLVAGISVGLLAIVSTLGPMGTLETLTLVHRFAYFGVITVFAAPICFAAGFFCVYAMRNRSVFSATLALALMCAVVAAPCSALAMVLYRVFHDGAHPTVSFLGVYSFGVLVSGVGTEFAFYVLCQRVSRTTRGTGGAEAGSRTPPVGPPESEPATSATTVPGSTASEGGGGTVGDPAHLPEGANVSDLTETGGTSDPAEDPSDSASGETRRLRLPPEIGRDMVYAHVSGHYVEVVTTSGKAVVYMRLADVVGALDGQGMQTHRSYWAAYRHIVRMHSDGHRTLLHLTGGHRVPVGRSFRDSVRACLKRRPPPQA